MNSLLAFPMYAVSRENTEALWRAVQRLLLARGVPASRSSDSDLLMQWQHPDLLLSQTCGYPLMTQLPDVQVVGCFHYAAPGCEGIHYRSFLVVREEDKHLHLAGFRGRRAVCNSPDSQSGYNTLRKRLAPVAVNDFFSSVGFSGSHRQSLIDVKRGEGDIAAIDCVTFALLQRHEAELLAGLVVIESTPLTPGLPLITARQTSQETLHAIRDALKTLVSAAEYRDVCNAVLIEGFSVVTRQPYEQLLD